MSFYINSVRPTVSCFVKHHMKKSICFASSLHWYQSREFVNVRKFSVTSNRLGSEKAEEMKRSTRLKNTISKSQVVVHLKDLDEHLRFKGYSALRWGLALLCISAYAVYHFREPIKENISVEMSDVASRSLGDQNVVMKANEVSRAVLFEIMNDPDALTLAIDFVTRLLKSEIVVQSATDLSVQIINDPSTRRSVGLLAVQTVRYLIEMEDTRTLILDYIKSLLLDEHTKAACYDLLKSLVEMPEVQAMVSNLLGSAVKSEAVTDQAIHLGKNVVHDVVNDQRIQEQTGNAIWSALKYVFTPRWFYKTPREQNS